MSLFPSFERNPFRVNAFTICEVPVSAMKSRDIDDRVNARLQLIENEEDQNIPAGAGQTYRVGAADLTGNQQILKDPNRRPREEIFVPEISPPPTIAAVEEFKRQHLLTPKAAETLLQFEPLDVSTVLVIGLPPVRLDPLAVEAPGPAVALPPRARLKPAALLVKAKDRRG